MLKKSLALLQQKIVARYGSRRAFCRHCAFVVLHEIGWFRKLERIDWLRVNRLVFVCKGNICRSPYAESRARSRGLNVTSFGLDADGQSSPDPIARNVALRRDVVLDGMRSRRADMREIRPGDLLLAMEPIHVRQLESLIAGAAGAPQVTLLGLWKKPPRPYIPDPFGLQEVFFANCFDSIDEAIEGVARMLAASNSERTLP